jgi:hypothetical protein
MTKKKAKSETAPKILELHIELNYIEPKVWRKFLVEDSTTMHELHEILQVVMGWMNSHLFMFKNKKLVISEPSPEDPWSDAIDFKDADKVKVGDIFKKKGDHITYEYDFGDSWTHTVRLEKVVATNSLQFALPRCISGENACPPEDCGGFPGFDNLKRVINDPDDASHTETIEWLDGYYPNYDPKEFSLSAVNKILKIGAAKFLLISGMFYDPSL